MSKDSMSGLFVRKTAGCSAAKTNNLGEQAHLLDRTFNLKSPGGRETELLISLYIK